MGTESLIMLTQLYDLQNQPIQWEVRILAAAGSLLISQLEQFLPDTKDKANGHNLSSHTSQGAGQVLTHFCMLRERERD